MLTALLALLALQDPAQEEKDYEALDRAHETLQKIAEVDAVFEEGTQLLLKIQEFRARYPKGQKSLAALELVSHVQITMGKKCLHAEQAAKAEGLFTAAVGAAREVVGRVKAMAEANRDSEKEEELERFRVYAELLYFSATFHLLLAVSEGEGRLGDLKERAAKMEEEFRAFMINYDTWVWALEAAVYMGRAVELIARRADPGNFIEATRAWEKVFEFLPKGRNLMKDKQWKADRFVRELSLKSTYYEMLARQRYAELLKAAGAPHERQLFKGLDLAEAVFFAYPDAGQTPVGKQILGEQARIEKALGR